ncbi:prostate-associated microseminoprotein-like [Coregonus clupeaformis]|uniref:prostate-associated microseminoprotein-like n=1 Tax=Coregonus clupeaformis TaxID=59861 RepID=UPI001BDFDE47|nr:prostate-associated microseminoprotein-like [Coregonus clupeaformis]
MTDPVRMMRMMLLALVFILSVNMPCLSVYNSGECYFDTKGSCEYMGQVYGIGESWMTKNCYQCVCMEPFGVGCCDHGSQIVDYPDWCDVIRKPDSCNTIAVMKDNHKLPCLWGRGRLRPGARQPWKSDSSLLFGSVHNSATHKWEDEK